MAVEFDFNIKIFLYLYHYSMHCILYRMFDAALSLKLTELVHNFCKENIEIEESTEEIAICISY